MITDNPMPEGRKNALQKLTDILYILEDASLVGLLMARLILASGQILLRNLFGSAIVWADVTVRILVLWVGLAGALVAARKGNHIRIDVFTRYLPNWAGKLLKGFAELATALICLIATWHSFRFVQMEYGGPMAFGPVPVWLCESAMPFAFAVLGLRYLVLSYHSFTKDSVDEPEPPQAI
jgi:TRAP-type C4-dicarboxylate transport system permease small subunit